MDSGRLEAFSDGVLAIIITIMVLEMEAPHDTTLNALLPIVPVFISYLISFIYVGAYWSNHHHLLQITEQVNGKILWANLHLLFWLSLIPFATSWVGENHVESLPAAFYGIILLMSAIAYHILQKAIIQNHHDDFALRKVKEGSKKGIFSLVLYILGVALSFTHPWLGVFCYIIVLTLWLIPDRKIEQNLNNEK